jgi:hypothetical protein
MLEKTAVCDIETIGWTTFGCIGFFDGESYEVFWSIEGLVERFCQKKYKGWKLYAHFGGRFDFRFFIPVLVDDGRFDLRFMERGSRLMSIKIKDKARRFSWSLLDSYFLLPASLKELGEAFKILHMKKEMDFAAIKTLADLATPDAQKYLMHDVLGLYEILEKFSDWGLNGGKLCLTLPSQSLRIFTNKFQEASLMPLEPDVEAFIRKGYFGGRVEIFRMRGENLNYYDVNSLYPFCMLQEMPAGRPIAVNERVKDLIGFYEIEADIPEGLHIPPLPVVANGKLFFPVGRGVFNTTEAELKILDRLNIKFKVKKGFVFSARGHIFKKFIEKMYSIRQQFPKGTLDNYVAKLVMNSLYGKFAQKRENTELIYSTELIEGSKVYDEHFNLYTLDTISRSRFILPYLSSYITSLARAHLFSLFLRAGLGRVYYCDTDSIITDMDLSTSSLLGGLKLEHRIKEAVFLQPKAYAFIDDNGKEFIKVKGMPCKNCADCWKENAAVKISEKCQACLKNKISISHFRRALETSDMSGINLKYFSILGFRECIKREKTLKIRRVEVSKQLNSLYNKRIVLKNNLTKPVDLVSLVSS